MSTDSNDNTLSIPASDSLKLQASSHLLRDSKNTVTVTIQGKNIKSDTVITATDKHDANAVLILDNKKDTDTCTITSSQPSCSMEVSAASGDKDGSRDTLQISSSDSTLKIDNPSLTFTFSKKQPPAPPAGGSYNWQQSHLSDIQQANVFAIYWGGGSTTAPVHISSNPPVNPWLNAQIKNYEQKPTSVLSSAKVKGFPSYIAMASVTETDASGAATQQLDQLGLDASFHYEGNGAGNRGAFFDGPGGYTP